MRYLLFSVLCFALPAVLSAQNALQKNVEWYSAKTFDKLNNAEVILDSKFVINKDRTIEWIQNQGQHVYQFTITGTRASWTDMKQNGTISYNVKCKNINGVITVGRENKDLFIELEFLENGVNTTPFRFNIERTEVVL